MTTITFKHSIGDKVWAAGAEYKDSSVLCPACFGEKYWTIIFGNGDREKCPCQTCKRGWEPGTGYIYFKEWMPTVRELTIGSVRFDDEPSYMCEETGVGSGLVYHEKDLFTSKDDALIAAQHRYERTMANIADNNFKKKGRFAQDLSTYGFTKARAFEEERQLKRWIALVKNSSVAPPKEDAA